MSVPVTLCEDAYDADDVVPADVSDVFEVSGGIANVFDRLELPYIDLFCQTWKANAYRPAVFEGVTFDGSVRLRICAVMHTNRIPFEYATAFMHCEQIHVRYSNKNGEEFQMPLLRVPGIFRATEYMYFISASAMLEVGDNIKAHGKPDVVGPYTALLVTRKKGVGFMMGAYYKDRGGW